MTDSTETPAVRRLPVLPLRDVVVYPHTVLPLFVGRERSVAALDQAMAGNREILLVAQTLPDIDEPGPKDVYEVGTLATILQLLKLPDGTVKVLVEGIRRARLRNLVLAESFTAEAEELPEGGEQDRVRRPERRYRRGRKREPGAGLGGNHVGKGGRERGRGLLRECDQPADSLSTRLF